MIKRRSLLAAPAILLLPRKAEAAYIRFAVNGPSDIWMYLDGRLNAPADTAQYPNLLDRYVPSGSPRRIRSIGGSYLVSDLDRRQPPWMVAGVDYFVGCPTPVGAFPTNKTAVIGPLVVGNLTTDFRNQVAAAGGTIDTSFFPILQISGATGLTFDGWDLSGLAFALAGSPNSIFRNSQLSATMAFRGQGLITDASGITVTNCTFDAGRHVLGALDNIYRMIDWAADATHPINCQYNWFKGSQGQFFSTASGPNGGTMTIKYNFLDDGFISASITAAITSCVAGTGGGGTWIRIGLNTAYTIATIPDGTTIAVAHVGGVPNSQGMWQSKFISNGVFELQGSTFAGSYTGGGDFSYQDKGNTNFNHGNSLQCAPSAGTGGGQLIWQFNTHRNQNWQSAAGPQIDGGFSGGTANAFSPHFDYNTSMAWTVAPPSPAFSNRQITQTWMFDEYSNVSFTCSNGTMTNNFIDASFAFGAFKKRRGGWAATGYVDTTGNTNMRDGRKFTLT